MFIEYTARLKRKEQLLSSYDMITTSIVLVCAHILSIPSKTSYLCAEAVP